MKKIENIQFKYYTDPSTGEIVYCSNLDDRVTSGQLKLKHRHGQRKPEYFKIKPIPVIQNKKDNIHHCRRSI